MVSHCIFFIYIIAYILFNFVIPSHSCGKNILNQTRLLLCVGGLVHGELAQRSQFLFSKQYDPQNMTYPDGYATTTARWLVRHEGSMVAGSFMPDWFLHHLNPFFLDSPLISSGDMDVQAEMNFLK